MNVRMKWNGLWVVGVLAAVLAASGCRMVRSSADAGGGEPALRLDRSAPYGDVVVETPPQPAPAPAAETAEPAMAVATNAAALPSTGGASYRLRSGDTLIIHLRTTQLEQIESLVDENGDVKMPFIGTVRAAGLTASELEDRIQKEYIEKKIYRYMTVHVLVPTRSYFVSGEVRAPGRFSLVGSVKVLQAIATAGGYTDFADRTNVLLTRGDKTIRVNAKDFQQSPEKDIEIESGDQIVVKRSWY